MPVFAQALADDMFVGNSVQLWATPNGQHVKGTCKFVSFLSYGFERVQLAAREKSVLLIAPQHFRLNCVKSQERETELTDEELFMGVPT